MKNNAWLLTDNSGHYFAVSDVEMMEFIPSILIHPVPITPEYCKHVIEWREYLIPVVNIAVLFDHQKQDRIQQIGIFAYQLADNQPLNYIAIALQATPAHISVIDAQLCDLPHYFTQDKRQLALSCFSYNGCPVPILNLGYLCSTQFRNTQDFQYPLISITAD